MTHLLSPKMPAPQAPPPPPPPFGEIQGQKPQRKAMAPTFLGRNVLPAGAIGEPALMGGGQTGKTLLGQ